MNNTEIIALVEKILLAVLSFPVIILIIILIFRKEAKFFVKLIEDKLSSGELSEIAFGSSGVSAKFVKTDSKIGEAKVTVSKVVVDPSKENLVTYSSGQYKFIISWDEKKYEGSSEKAAQLDKLMHANNPIFAQTSITFLILRKAPIFDVRPSVNVVVEPIEKNMSIAQYVHKNIMSMKSMGFEILSSTIDEKTKSGYAEYQFTGSGGFQFCKLVVTEDFGYVVTATLNPGESPDSETPDPPIPLDRNLLLNAEVRSELRTILNSFELVKPAE